MCFYFYFFVHLQLSRRCQRQPHTHITRLKAEQKTNNSFSQIISSESAASRLCASYDSFSCFITPSSIRNGVCRRSLQLKVTLAWRGRNAFFLRAAAAGTTDVLSLSWWTKPISLIGFKPTSVDLLVLLIYNTTSAVAYLEVGGWW